MPPNFHNRMEMVYLGSGSCCLGSARKYSQVGASFPPGLTLELHKGLLGSTVTWAVPYPEPSTD